MEKWMKWFLIACILFGILIRFYGFDNYFLYEDEPRIMISAIKFHHESFESGVNYLAEHPPLARWFMGLPSIFVSEYNFQNYPGVGDYVFEYIYFREIAANFISLRLLSAIVGTLTIGIIFILTRKVFDKKSALFAVLISSLSLDFIFYSKVAFMESYLALFSLASVYFYFKFLENKTNLKYGYFFLFFFFMMLAIGSRTLTPLFLIATIILFEFFISKNNFKANLLVTLSSIIVVILIYFIFYPPNISKYLFEFKKTSDVSGFLGFGLMDVISSIFFRNSYLFLFSIISTTYLIFRKTFFLGNNRYAWFFVLYFIISFIALSVTNLSDLIMRYSFVMFLPLAILGGKALSIMSESKIFNYIIAVFIIINLFGIVYSYPYYSTYSNFGDKEHKILYQNSEVIEKFFEFLNSIGSPPIYSSHTNTLIFYKSKSDTFNIPLIAHEDPRCNEQAVELVKQINPVIVYKPSGSEIGGTIKLDGRYCKLIADFDLEEIYNAGRIKLYRIVQ